jgi:hypothetical protein
MDWSPVTLLLKGEKYEAIVVILRLGCPGSMVQVLAEQAGGQGHTRNHCQQVDVCKLTTFNNLPRSPGDLRNLEFEIVSNSDMSKGWFVGFYSSLSGREKTQLKVSVEIR